MPLHLEAAGGIEMANQFLDGHLGVNRSSVAPDEYQIEGWFDDPREEDAEEADFTGYTPNVWDSDNWDDAEGALKSTSSAVSLGTPSTTGSDAIRFFALRNTTSGELAFSGRLERPTFAVIGKPAEIIPTLFWPGTT